MFSDLILRNSRRSRKENGLFFGSLIISIVAFYIILSLSHQDVMLFLREMICRKSWNGRTAIFPLRALC